VFKGKTLAGAGVCIDITSETLSITDLSGYNTNVRGPRNFRISGFQDLKRLAD
jgi:hypothetical protein